MMMTVGVTAGKGQSKGIGGHVAHSSQSSWRGCKNSLDKWLVG